VDGNEKLSTMEEYNSHNTYRLSVEAVKDKLLTLDFVREELGMNEVK
jgi:UDP-glucose 4-epimerase